MTSALKNAIETIGNTITDLTELKVQTVIGDVNVVLKKKTLAELEALLTPDGADTQSEAALQLVLDTTIKFDGDSINFIDVEKTTAHPELLALHKGAVEAGLKQRQGLVEMFRDVIR